MKTLKLKENLYYVGVQDKGLKVFDAIMPTSHGTTYNSYLLETSEGGVIFEGSKAGFEKEYLEHISSIIDLKNIKYVVVAHTEPDHSGAIEALLKENPDITVIASPAGGNNLKNILKFPFKLMTMTPGKKLSVGQYTLSFLSGLFCHWPDVLFTYIEELKALVSCDAFGAHYASNEILLSKEKNIPLYQEMFDYYFKCIMSPFASYAIKASELASKLNLDLLLTGHGPVIDKDVYSVIDRFKKEGEKYLVINDDRKVTIVYASCYGYTKKMALYLADKFKDSGKEVLLHEIDALNYNDEKPRILDDIRVSGKVLFGSPTVINDAVSLFYDILISAPVTMFINKQASVFGDYGWSGEAISNLSTFLTLKKFKVIEGFKYSFKIDDNGYKALDEYFERIK